MLQDSTLLEQGYKPIEKTADIERLFSARQEKYKGFRVELYSDSKDCQVKTLILVDDSLPCNAETDVNSEVCYLCDNKKSFFLEAPEGLDLPEVFYICSEDPDYQKNIGKLPIPVSNC